MEVQYDTIKLCRICNEPYGNNLKTVNDGKEQETLESLLLELDISISEKLDICNNCVDNIKMCCTFKSTCLNTENYVTSFISKDKDKVDIKEIYLNTNEIKSFTDHDTVCRLCLRMRDRNLCIDLKEETKDKTLLMIMLKQYFPKMDLNITLTFDICAACHKSLQSYFDLMNSCADLRYEFETTNKNDNIVHIIPKHALKEENEYSDYCITQQNSYKDNSGAKNQQWETESHNLYIKNEEIEIKSDDIDLESAPMNENSTDDKVRTNKCPHCNYQTKIKSYLRNHMVIHVPSSEVIMHKCTKCNFETKHHRSLHRHMASHNSEVTTHRCKDCGFESKHRFNLKSYRVVKGSLRGTMHKCTECSFETKPADCRRSHLLDHETTEELTIYKCHLCKYVTKSKHDLNKHILIHKNRSEVTVHKCTICTFEAIRKDVLNRHMVVHKSNSEVTMHKCTLCSFESKHRNCVRNHMKIHKSTDDVAMNKCVLCEYQTRSKYDLNKHMVVHKSRSELIVHKCTLCNFETIRKNALDRHMVVHKSSCEVAMYKCVECSYETKYKNVLNKHLIIHKSFAELPAYVCDECSFKTKHKDSFRRHLVRHRRKMEVGGLV